MAQKGKIRLPAHVRAYGLALCGLLLACAPPLSRAQAQVGSVRYSEIMVEARGGQVLTGVNQDELRYPASLTKLMTLYLTFEALRDRRIQLDQIVPVSAWAAAQAPSKLGLQPGEALTVEQAILGLVTKSANDAAAALGELLGGTEDRFAQMMTLRAHALGMNRTNFRNASGLPDANQWSTARDLSTLGRRIVLDFPRYYGYFATPAFVWRNRVIPNHHSLLRTYAGADGMKTGYTGLSGYNLVTSAVRGNVRLIGVVMGAASAGERDQHMASLLDDGFNRAGAPAVAWGEGGRFSLAGMTRGFSLNPIRAANAAETGAAGVSRIAHDRAVQVGGFPAERTAWEITQELVRLAPNGQPRVQPILSGGQTSYHAQLFGLTEVEARSLCATLPRRGYPCQAFRMAPGMVAQR